MYESLGVVVLKDGERVEAGVVACPDPAWAERIEALLGHKGEIWRWQNRCCARDELGLDARYYLLHRDGDPFANMLTATYKGVGHFGHVFTIPEDRRKRAAHQLMGLLMEDFRQRSGRALFLGTGFDSAPYHIYRRHGFEGLQPGSGQMEYYVDGDGGSFREAYFATGDVETGVPEWRHWPASGALFTSTFDGVVRCPSLGLHGRNSTEAPFLEVLKRAQHDRENQYGIDTIVTERTDTGAVVAVARKSRHPLWSHRQLLDLYGHPEAQQEMSASVEALGSLDAGCVSYSDGNETREAVLSAAGFREISRLPQWVGAAKDERTFVEVGADVGVWAKS
ncbi:MAG: hypothetical protein VX290_12810 [Candidatus Latescibacterota bacterium]|nr:hypothetical protein [Candidatus Latescibacterota bacterium]